MKSYWVYILASQKNGTLYVGVTGNITSRTFQHKEKGVESFTKKYSVSILVYAEEFSDIYEALICEKRIKKWNRKWKLKLIEKHNPQWKDLYESPG